jgi:hypothetical protein
MLTTFAASAAVDISRIGAELEVLPTGCHQGGLQAKALGLHMPNPAMIRSRLYQPFDSSEDRQLGILPAGPAVPVDELGDLPLSRSARHN